MVNHENFLGEGDRWNNEDLSSMIDFLKSPEKRLYNISTSKKSRKPVIAIEIMKEIK